jgi:hypothetical protein
MPTVEAGVWYKMIKHYKEGKSFNCLFYFDIPPGAESKLGRAAVGLHAMVHNNLLIQIASGRNKYPENDFFDIWEPVSEDNIVYNDLICWSNKLYIKKYLLLNIMEQKIYTVSGSQLVKTW